MAGGGIGNIWDYPEPASVWEDTLEFERSCHTIEDWEALEDAGFDPRDILSLEFLGDDEQVRECPVCGEENIHLAGYCDTHYQPPAITRKDAA